MKSFDLDLNFKKINLYPTTDALLREAILSLSRKGKKPLIILADFKKVMSVSTFLEESGICVKKLGDLDILPFESLEPSPQNVSARIEALEAIKNGNCIVIADVMAALKKTAPPSFYGEILTLRVGDNLPQNFSRWLVKKGYARVETVRNIGEFAMRGEIIDVFTPISGAVRFETFDDEIESLRKFDAETQLSTTKISGTNIYPYFEFDRDAESRKMAEERLKEAEHSELFNTDERKMQGMAGLFWKDSHCALDLLNKAEYLIVYDPQACRKKCVEYEREVIELYGKEYLELYRRFSYVAFDRVDHHKEILISSKALNVPFDEVKKVTDLPTFSFENEEIGKKVSENVSVQIGEISEINKGDLVVHSDHGIGVYEGTEILSDADGEHEYLKIRYRHNAMLYVPIEKFTLVNKYVGSGEKAILSDINGKEWRKTKERVRKDIEIEIDSMIQLYAEREMSVGYSFEPDPELEAAFAKTFKYVETPDQAKAIKAVLQDMESIKPMDRLICGDTGFGKTEIALRAAFRAVVNGKQVALLAPTTVLARQHYRLFSSRMEPFGIKVVLLTAHLSAKERKTVFEDISHSKVDIVIGTHSLINPKLSFGNLGLVIIDEEQRFGTKQKDFLRKLRLNVDVLTLAATPIPRTLHMALSGIKKISVIQTPPIGRSAPKIYIAKWNEKIVQGAVLRETNRGGQVFYIHNRVSDLDVVTKKLRSMFPTLKIENVHGRMSKNEFLRIVDGFYKGKIDVLVATSVVENGIDVPNANTLIVDDVERYGLGQLYQLKGRVGRSNRRAFVYLTYFKEPSREVLERLKALAKFSTPGSAMELALKDMEIRGVGEVFGFRQHGHIDSVGLYMYREILKQAMAKIQGKEIKQSQKSLNVDLPSSILPKSYISDSIERMKIYKKLASAESVQDVDAVIKEMKDRFGRIPSTVFRLLDHSKIRVIAASIGIQSMKNTGKDVEITFEDIESLTNFKRFYKECLTNPSKNVMILRDVIQNGNLKKLLNILLDYHQNMAMIKEGVS